MVKKKNTQVMSYLVTTCMFNVLHFLIILTLFKKKISHPFVKDRILAAAWLRTD